MFPPTAAQSFCFHKWQWCCSSNAIVDVRAKHAIFCLWLHWWAQNTIYGAFSLHGTARYSSLLGGFHCVQYLVPGTFFSTTSAEVPSEPYRYQNVTCKLITDSLWIVARDTTDPLDLNQHSQRRIERNCFEYAHLFKTIKKGCFVLLLHNRGTDPARAWWSDAE